MGGIGRKSQKNICRNFAPFVVFYFLITVKNWKLAKKSCKFPVTVYQHVIERKY